MFSVVFGFIHPRLCEEMPNEKYNFFDIGETEAHALILKNLMKEVLDYKSHQNIDLVFNDFCKSRAISNDDNQHFQRLLDIFNECKKWYTGNKTSATKMYLVRMDGNKVVDICHRWNMYREIPDFIPKKRKSKDPLYV